MSKKEKTIKVRTLVEGFIAIFLIILNSLSIIYLFTKIPVENITALFCIILAIYFWIGIISPWLIFEIISRGRE